MADVGILLSALRIAFLRWVVWLGRPARLTEQGNLAQTLPSSGALHESHLTGECHVLNFFQKEKQRLGKGDDLWIS